MTPPTNHAPAGRWLWRLNRRKKVDGLGLRIARLRAKFVRVGELQPTIPAPAGHLLNQRPLDPARVLVLEVLR